MLYKIIKNFSNSSSILRRNALRNLGKNASYLPETGFLGVTFRTNFPIFILMQGFSLFECSSTKLL